MRGGAVTLAAWLQPAGEIGGDTFDFSLDRDALHLSMTDAMGHTMDAALLATVLVGGLRNARRRGVELAEQARLANDALVEQADESQFVTGLLVRIDLPRATAGIVNAGHPPPLRLRAGASIKFLWRPTARSGCGREGATACKRCPWRSATG